MEINYKLGGKELSFNLEGGKIIGDDIVLLKNDVNLIANTSWSKTGFSIEKFLFEDDFKKIKQGITSKISQLLSSLNIDTDDSFSLINYHKYVNDDTHLQVAKAIKYGWNVQEFPINFETINNRISEIVGIPVSAVAKHIDFNNFFLRLVRPQSYKDNNPPHKDVWIDRLRNAVNIYVPLCGSNSNSSLGILPGSHLLKESEIERTDEGALLNGTKFTVPCVTAIKNKPVILTRPDPKENEVMIFSPYLIHGGGYNFNEDETRMSLEVRFWKKD